jgi:hypothetical protein
LRPVKYRVHPPVFSTEETSAGRYAFRPSSGGAFSIFGEFSKLFSEHGSVVPRFSFPFEISSSFSMKKILRKQLESAAEGAY